MIRTRNKTTAFQELIKLAETKNSGTGTGTVNTIVQGNNITVDATDPENPIINADVGIKDINAGSPKVTIDKTDAENPVIDVTGFLEDVIAVANLIRGKLKTLFNGRKQNETFGT